MNDEWRDDNPAAVPAAALPDPTVSEAADAGEESAAEQPSWRKALAVVPLLLLVVGGVMWTLPGSPLKQAIPRFMWEAAQVPALQQNWGMFAPDPPDLTMDVEGIITFEDGSTEVVRVPRGNPLFASIYSERWRKWEERLYPVGSKDSWPAAARWFAERAGAATDRTPKMVALQRRWKYAQLPGRPAEEQDRAFVFFELDLASGEQRYGDPELGGKGAPATGGGS